MKNRYIVRLDFDQNSGKSWLIFDTLSEKVIRKYTENNKATEVAECKNWDYDNNIFNNQID